MFLHCLILSLFHLTIDIYQVFYDVVKIDFKHSFLKDKAMESKINIIKAKFEIIKTILGDSLTIEDLSQPKYLKVLIDASENTYLQLNDGMCASLNMCKECAQKRDMLNNYIQLFDSIELGKQLGDSIEAEIERFPHIIEDIISKIDAVLAKL